MLRPCAMLLLLAAASLLVGANVSATAPPFTPVSPICHAESKDDPSPPARALLTGYGTGGFAVRTSSPEAQAYFDNGMQLAHAFAHTAATSAFKRAAQLDPTCAMCLWGVAWSRGPTINYGIGANDQAELLALADRAAILGANGPPKERALIAALQKRYHAGGGGGPGDYAFARSMDDLARTYPADDEVAVMTADAWMLPAVHKHDHSHLDRAIEILEAALRRAPDDTGAIHFYIHATEMNGVGARALPYAEKLQALAPSASHLVHMPSHTYFWVGRYRQAEQSNLDAVAIDEQNALRLKLKDGVFGLPYYGHNVQFGEGAALMDGDARGALSLAAAQVGRLAAINPDKIFEQIGLGAAYFVYGRYGAQTDVAALTDPGSKMPYARAMWRYAKGEAAARRGDARDVRAQASAITATTADLKPFGDFAPQAQAMVEVARLVLTGRAAMLEGRYADAETAYRQAAETQEAKLGQISDPPAWWYPVRRSLAAALEAQGKPQAAAAETRRVIARWAYDPVSLEVLADSERREGQAEAARRDAAYARANWTGDPASTPLALR